MLGSNRTLVNTTLACTVLHHAEEEMSSATNNLCWSDEDNFIETSYS